MPEKVDSCAMFKHFELQRLADGVYAAIGITGGAAYSNAGIVDLGDGTLVFDTFMTPQAGAELRRAAEELTGRPASTVIVSHCHSDHWMGNQVFPPEVPIIATETTYATMPEAVSWLRDLRANPAELEKEIDQCRVRLKTEGDPRQRESLELAIVQNGHLLEALADLAFRLPNVTFEGRLAFRGKGRDAVLLTVAPGHTASDAYLVLPRDRIVFMGDLGFFQCQPFMAFCEPQAWIAQLETMEGRDVETFVPGHGPLGSKADLALQREYIALLEDRVAGVLRAGGSVDDALTESLPVPFDAWLGGGMARWEANVRSSYERLSAA